MRMRGLHRAILLLCLAGCGLAGAAEISLPLRIPVAVLQQSLRDTLSMQDSGPTEIFRQGDCRYIRLEDVQLAPDVEQLRMSARSTLKFGPEWFGDCYGAIDWRGLAHFTLEPYITPDQLLRYRLRDTHLVDEQGRTSLAADLVFKLLARIMQPRLEAFQIDLRPPRSEVANVLHNFVPAAQVEEVDRILASARASALTIEDDEVQIALVFDVPEHYLAQAREAVAPDADAAPLTIEELADFERTSQAWDAFLVYIIRSLGLDIDDPGIRIRLLEILLDSRYQVAGILSGEIGADDGDPTRDLFVTTWADLHALIDEAGRRGLLRGRLLAYLSFLTAGDALFFLDNMAPGLGLEISEEGLRRLARAMRPADPNDPLRFDWGVDPFLQELFELDLPRPPPASSAYPRWLDFLIPAARAEAAGDVLAQLSARLGGWVPAADELETYRALMATLLEGVRERETERADLTEEELDIFRYLVPATALIESCWRQFVRSGDDVTHIRSPSGSIGLMQINPQVWRGIFDVERLKKDTGYNAYAGTRILLRYLRLHARPIAARTGAGEDLARASYAAYNAGPRAAGRILRPERAARIRQIDDKFWNIYQSLEAGGGVDLQACTVTPPAS
jgi:hypothetical protein